MAFGLPQNQLLVQPVAAESIDGVNKVLVRALRDNQRSVIMEWTVSNDWASPVTTKILVGQEILEAETSFIDEIGLKEHLSPTRANGLVSMVKQLKLYAVAYQSKLSQ